MKSKSNSSMIKTNFWELGSSVFLFPLSSKHHFFHWCTEYVDISQALQIQYVKSKCLG